MRKAAEAKVEENREEQEYLDKERARLAKDQIQSKEHQQADLDKKAKL
jgi:hypothetical protein